MNSKNLAINNAIVEAELNIRCSPIVRKRVGKGKLVYTDVQFQFHESPSHDFVRIQFKNYYAASLTIVHLEDDCEVGTILDNFRVMSSAYSEEDSQKIVTIPRNAFSSNFIPGKPVRIYLFQPNPQWQAFEIQNIKAFGRVMKSSSAVSMSNQCEFSLNCQKMLLFDLSAITKAIEEQRNLVEQPAFNANEYKRVSKKKDKKKDKKTVSRPAPEDDMGIALATYGKEDTLETTTTATPGTSSSAATPL